jgi:hypothetical protein
MHEEFLKGPDTAVNWIEHVIRFNGTKHLKPTSQNIPFYQLYLLDVGLFLVVISFIIVVVTANMVRFIIWCLLASLKKFKTTPSYKSNLKKIT